MHHLIIAGASFSRVGSLDLQLFAARYSAGVFSCLRFAGGLADADAKLTELASATTCRSSRPTENVGFRSHSLRQPIRAEHSLLPCKRAGLPDKPRPSSANLTVRSRRSRFTGADRTRARKAALPHLAGALLGGDGSSSRWSGSRAAISAPHGRVCATSQREVTREVEPGSLYDAATDEVESKAFIERSTATATSSASSSRPRTAPNSATSSPSSVISCGRRSTISPPDSTGSRRPFQYQSSCAGSRALAVSALAMPASSVS
jgi:hypothetical protein